MTLINFIKQFEGIRLTPYLCQAGIPTIGIGSTMYADGTKVKLSDKPITESEALELFSKTLKQYENAVDKEIKVPLSENQRIALISFTYNVGISAFKTSTLLKKLNNKDYNLELEFTRWNKIKGNVSKGLTKRRKLEWELFNS